jgi:hypothetical protein
MITFGALGSIAPAFAAPVSPSPGTTSGSNDSSPQPQDPTPQRLDAPPTANQQQSWKKEGIPSIWPADEASLWVPIREARYSTDKPIDAADVRARITGGVLDEELVRITKGNGVTSVLFRMPNLEPGTYSIAWTEAGTTKTTQFELQQPVLAPGGGNHRHESTTKGVPPAEKIALAFVVITGGLALLNVTGLWWIPLAVSSALGALTALIASIVAFVTAYGSAGINDNAWATAFSSPGVWGFLIIALTMGAMPLTRSMSTLGRLAAVGTLSAVAAGAGHSHASLSQTMTVTVSVIIGMAGAATVAVALNSINPKTVVQVRDRLLVGGSLAVMAIASVFVHSMFAPPTGAFVDAYLVRAATAAVLAGALVTIRPWGSGRSRAVLSIVAILFVVASVIVLTQVPPLTAGI